MNGLGYSRRGLHGRVVSDLGLRIVAGAWPSGDPLPNEDDLAAERTAVATAIRARDADASEAAMRSLVEVGWRRVVAEDSRREGRP